MMDTEHFEDLYHAYRAWAGEPYSVSTFRRDGDNIGKFTSLDILCYRSEAPDHLRPEDEFTFLATAGLSCQNDKGFTPPCELIWRIAGRRSWDEIQAVSETLAKIAVLPLYQEEISFARGMVVSGVTLPLFAGMDSFLITDWGIRGPEYLPGLQPPVLLRWLKPLYNSEISLVEQVGDQELGLMLKGQGIDWDNPDRVAIESPNQSADRGESNGS